MKFDRAVAVYILDDRDRVLLLLHKKLGTWLPPGGHVEEELVHEAALREVHEEAGLEIEFIYDTAEVNSKGDNRARILPQPLLVQLEDVGDHYHEDFVYLARAKGVEFLNTEGHEMGWFTLEEAKNLKVFDNVRRHIDYIKEKLLFSGK